MHTRTHADGRAQTYLCGAHRYALNYYRDKDKQRQLGAIPLQASSVHAFREDLPLLGDCSSFAFCVQVRRCVLVMSTSWMRLLRAHAKLYSRRSKLQVGDGQAARHRMYMLAADSAELRDAWVRLIDSAR